MGVPNSQQATNGGINILLHFSQLVCLFVYLFFWFGLVWFCLFYCRSHYEETLLTLSVTEASALNLADVWGGTQTPETGLGAPCCAMQRFQLGI